MNVSRSAACSSGWCTAALHVVAEALTRIANAGVEKR
jgi:hypothetical protein